MYAEKAMRYLKQELFRSFMRSSLENTTGGKTHSGEGIAAINTDANTASGIYMNAIRNLMTMAVTIILSTVVLISIDWRLGLASFCVGLFGFIVQHRFTEPIAKISKARLDANADTVKSASNTFSGAIVIRAFNIHSKALANFDKESERIRILDFRRAFISMWQGLFTTVQFWMTMVVVFAFGGWLVATGQLDFHMLMMAPAMSATLTGSFSYIGRAYANMQAPIEGAKRVFAIIENNPTNELARDYVNKNAEGYKLSINSFNFSYAGAEAPTLTDINLKVGENQMIALVGESGSGKSTLLKAIIGFYERDDMNINIGGISINETCIRDWRRYFAYVDQSCKLFDMSVKENIAMGKGGKASDAEIIAAAKRAAAHEFINNLEDGYDTQCGEKGGALSGGQRQRIAIARALIKSAPILVFDEATSALDTDSERYIMETIESLRSDHTILITTHNLMNIVSADTIVVMDSGRVVEMGTHPELMGNCGLYHRLYNSE